LKANLKNWLIALIVILAAPFSLAAYDNSPAQEQILPEVIWAVAAGGGIWTTDIQITDFTGGSVVRAFFYYGGGNYRGPLTIWTSPGQSASIKIQNILGKMEDLDWQFFYSGKVGSLRLLTQDSTHKIHVTARTKNGNYSKTFPGLNNVDSNTASTTRRMVITDLAQNSIYRSTVGVFNPTSSSVTVQFQLISSAGTLIGYFTKTMDAYDFQAFYPFAEAGVGSGTYDNVWLYVPPIYGTGKVFCFGATANNYTNDPAAHIAVQFQ